MDDQPSQEQFENELFYYREQLDPDRTVWLEDESVRIGRLFIPAPLFARMEQAPVILVSSATENRIQRLVRDYSMANPEALSLIFTGLKKRLGEERMQEALKFVSAGNYSEAAKIALHHYDKVYARQLLEKKERVICSYNLDNKDLTGNVLELINLRSTINFSI
ncbi:MAG: hypothetical protein U0T82_03570 [Bacteroidales bacterium]